MPFFDSHSHLESAKFEPDREQVIERARDAGVSRILTCGSDVATSIVAVELAASHAGLYAAAGIHGHEASSAADSRGGSVDDFHLDEEVFRQLGDLAAQPHVVALGEIGLDYHYDFSPRPVQRAVLARQLTLASELGLPVVLHNRESDQDMRDVVDAAPKGLRGVLHCFLADVDMARWALDRGLYIGVGGPITFKNIRHLPGIIKTIPLDRLVIETDSPYLAPHPKRGMRNEPAFVTHVAARLAQILALPVSELAERTTENASALLRIA